MRDIVSYVRIAVFERGMMGDGRFFGGFSFFFFLVGEFVFVCFGGRGL